MNLHKSLLTALISAGLIEADATQGEAVAALKAWAKISNNTLPADLASEAAVKPLVEALGKRPAATPPPPATPPVVPANPVATADGVSPADLAAMVNITGLSAEVKNELLTSLLPKAGAGPLSTSQVLDAINAKCQVLAKPAGPGNPALPNGTSAGEVEKLHAAARDAMVLSNLGGPLPEKVYDFRSDDYVAWKPDRRNYGLASPLNIARQCLMAAGVPANRVLNLAPMQVAKLVMGTDPAQLGIGGLFAGDGAYNVSGMFSNILLDARNVSLRKSFDDTKNITFDRWMAKGPDIADFKTVNRVIAGELNDPAAIPEDGEFEETTLSDGKESYKLTVWGRMISRSWQLIVNDQLGAFTELEMKMGAAMKRKMNRLAYQVLKDNAALSDAVALFHASAVPTGHNNITTGALTTVADYAAALNTLHQKMSQQKGLDTDSGVLNFVARFLVYPPALRGIIMQLLVSPSSDATNPGITNIWQQSIGGLAPIEDAELGSASSGGSDVKWYTSVDASQCDTIEYAFLQGMPAPVIEQETAFDRLAIRSRIYFAFGTKALDYRGLQRHNGA